MASELLYILDEDGNPVPQNDVSAWQRWMATTNRIVCATRAGQYNISTVFLGSDHATTGKRILVFETKAFGEPELNLFARCSTRHEAIIQHRRILAEVNGMPMDELPARKSRQERRAEIEEAARKVRAELEKRIARADAAFNALATVLDGDGEDST